MKKILGITLALSLVFSVAFAAWDPTRPTDDELKKDVPAVTRANWLAIQLGTDAALLITNDKVSPTAAIVDTKLAQITTAAKVSGTALTLLANIPSSAGVIPAANLPTDNVKLTGTQTIAGVKTFSSSPIVPTPTTDYQAATKLYTDTKVSLTGNETVAGIKTFSSSPIVPTPTTDYQAATKKYVDDHPGVPSGAIVMWSGSIATIPSGWYLCNGSNGTPDLRDRFVIAADADSGGTYDVGDTGDGSIPAHTHILETLVGYGESNRDAFTSAGGVGINYQSNHWGGEAWTDSPHPAHERAKSSGTGTKNIAVYYALAYIMKG